ncbi:MAG: sigma-70 family RNA polymerase sigma factor [Phycisphaerales bacterium]|nr:sigma-70 family RNA polymerase sigma factor [Phycisphaerales bacterium]
MRTDEQIVDDVLAGEQGAFAQVVRRYERQVHAMVWGILRDHHAAEDVTQEVFIKAYERLGEWRGGALGAWLVAIARRAAIDQVRRNKWVGRGGVTAEFPEMAATDPTTVEDAAEVLAALGRLGEQEQQVILLRYFSGLQVSEIAAVVGSPVGTITKQLSRAMARLREYLRVDP